MEAPTDSEEPLMSKVVDRYRARRDAARHRAAIERAIAANPSPSLRRELMAMAMIDRS
jgi:hypothetical protein